MQGSMQSETIYDHPLYYDILFGWDRAHDGNEFVLKRECTFIVIKFIKF